MDPEQLDKDDEDKEKGLNDKPDPTGVGLALRTHWQECVKAQVDVHVAEVRFCFAAEGGSGGGKGRRGREGAHLWVMSLRGW